MAEAVIDELEVVQVDEHQRQVVAQACRPRQALLDPIVEQYAVGQTGQQVMVGLPLQLLLVMLALGDVLHRALVADELAIGAAHHVGILGNPDARAIAPVDL